MKIEIPTNVILQNVNQEAVLLNLNNGQYFELNETGAVIYKALHDFGTKTAACEQLVRNFQVSNQEALDDIDTFINSLQDLALAGEKKAD